VKYKAVIFDLFGTLVDNLSHDEYCSVLLDMADILEAPADDFTDLWINTFNQRMVGALHSPDGNIEYACGKLGVPLNDHATKQASRIRFDYEVASVKPRAGAIETLSLLRSMGYKTGLITNCSTELPAMWANTEFAPLFDAAVFSCTEKVMKPDQRIYELALERLAIDPHDCLYVGDGSNDELSGAAEIGMDTVMIRVPYEEQNMYQIDEKDWDGIKISSLGEVLDLL